MLSFALILVVTICLSFLPERFLKPLPPRLKINNLFLQSLLVSNGFLFLTLIVQRPIFSGLAILVFLIILITISNAKYKALKEPMVFSDFAMFAQAFKHPRLYFPFLGLLPVILAPLIIAVLIYIVLTLEPAMAFTAERILSTIVAVVVIYYLSKTVAIKSQPVNNPEKDNYQFGLQNSLFTYFMHSRTDIHKEAIKETLRTSPFNLNGYDHSNDDITESTSPPVLALLCKSKKPNITVIQSESFFDARRLHPSIRVNVLKNFDAVNAESIQYGKLEVPAWGANTMRSEFTFLTGIKFNQLGFYRYYPYQFISDFTVPSIASSLQAQGYHCVCIHPHHASFFGRDKIFPKMGFDEFIDINDFYENQNFGPYISDQSVSNKILEITNKHSDKPLFIFVITMENHGPLHLEKTTTDEHQDFYSISNSNVLPTKLNDLTVYLRHLKNADIMIKTLTDHYKKEDHQKNIETRLCFYGDHIPSMPNIYTETNYCDENSDYFIWSSGNNEKGYNNSLHEDISIDTLALSLFKL